MDRADQVSAVSEIVERAGVHDLTKKFMKLLASKRRLFAIPA